jgi:hypothetical protein
MAARLEQALGANLVSLLLYGAAVRGAAARDRGGIELLLIVRDATAEALGPAAAAIAGWVKGDHPAPLIFSEAEWRASADVFPIEVEDMREAHRLLRGGDPFALVTTSRADLRAELEREVRGKLLKLRAEYAAAAADGRRLGVLLEQSAGTFFVLLRAVLRLAGRTPPPEAGAVVVEVASVAGLDPAAFAWVLARRAGGKTAALQPFDPVAVRYLDAIERLAKWVDEARSEK